MAKTVKRTVATFGDVAGPWRALARVPVEGYEIHHGQTAWHPMMGKGREVIPGLAWQDLSGRVLGIYLHGLFEDARVLQALFGAASPPLDATFERLAALAESCFGAAFLGELAGLAGSP